MLYCSFSIFKHPLARESHGYKKVYSSKPSTTTNKKKKLKHQRKFSTCTLSVYNKSKISKYYRIRII